MNSLRLLTILATVAVLAALEINQQKYKEFGRTEGSAMVGIQEALVTLSLIQCGVQCLSDPNCNGYSTMDREEGGYFCMKTTCPDLLPVGKWSTYSKTGPDNGVKIKILHRQDGSVSFGRHWADYKAGFGCPDGKHWLGLDKQHHLTTEHSYGLNVTMKAWDGNSLWAFYSQFSVGPESDNYRLSVSGYDIRSTAGDSLSDHNNMGFSTPGHDNDGCGGECILRWHYPWWYSACFNCIPTGSVWYHAPGYTYPYYFKEMTLTLIRQ